MCFDVKSKVKKATRDITVYKELGSPRATRNGKLFAYSPYRSAKWTEGKLMTAKMKTTCDDGDIINKGLHAYRTRKDARDNANWFYKATIPKGSLYYVNKGDGEVVANQMIIKNMTELS